MRRKAIQIAFCLIALAASAAAQTTTVTNNDDGASGTVPTYSGSAMPTNSPIYVSGSNVGIGLTNPGTPLDVNQYLHVTGSTNPTTTERGAYLSWNAFTRGWGETDFINNQGGGYGGFAFMNTPSSGSPRTTLMLIDGANGNVGIGTTSPSATLEVNGNVKLTSGTGASITFADGTVQSTAYTGVTCGGDFAESVDVSGNRKHYEPGDVLIINEKDPANVRETAEPYSTSVAGIYSTKPGYVGRRLTGPKTLAEVPDGNGRDCANEGHR